MGEIKHMKERKTTTKKIARQIIPFLLYVVSAKYFVVQQES